uniref:Uncharacterized protein n=1 Tax=Macrostomum lignano TaxID=282301 RepID=A0A1I8FNS5_9PLAT
MKRALGLAEEAVAGEWLKINICSEREDIVASVVSQSPKQSCSPSWTHTKPTQPACRYTTSLPAVRAEARCCLAGWRRLHDDYMYCLMAVNSALLPALRVTQRSESNRNASPQPAYSTGTPHAASAATAVGPPQLPSCRRRTCHRDIRCQRRPTSAEYLEGYWPPVRMPQALATHSPCDFEHGDERRTAGAESRRHRRPTALEAARPSRQGACCFARSIALGAQLGRPTKPATSAEARTDSATAATVWRAALGDRLCGQRRRLSDGLHGRPGPTRSQEPRQPRLASATACCIQLGFGGSGRRA